MRGPKFLLRFLWCFATVYEFLAVDSRENLVLVWMDGIDGMEWIWLGMTKAGSKGSMGITASSNDILVYCAFI